MEKAKKLLDFIYQSSSPFHCIKHVTDVLNTKGFKPLNLKDKWHLSPGSSYYIIQNNSSIFAFIFGNKPVSESGFKIIAAHSDSPTLKIKPQADYSFQNGYIKLHTEVYGSAILMSWFDRPLSVAGQVTLKGKGGLEIQTRLVDLKEAIAIIPNLAIHLNRSVNEGVEIKKHIDLEPLMATVKESLEMNNMLLTKISEALNVKIDDILDFDLNLYEATRGTICGANNEFISSGRLDDLEMVYSGLMALAESSAGNATKLLAIFDNEEVGSYTKQGAGSPILKQLIARIVEQEGDRFNENLSRTVANSFMISADMAHAAHPNKWDLHDSKNQPILNGGPVIKYSANQKYTTDGRSAAIFKQLCMKAGVPYQTFTNRSDMAGGSTLGNVSVAQLEIDSVDVGNPMLAMHSIRELGGCKDIGFMQQVFEEFWR